MTTRINLKMEPAQRARGFVLENAKKKKHQNYVSKSFKVSSRRKIGRLLQGIA